MSVLRSLNDSLLDLVFPTCCLGCDRRGTWFCDACDAASRLTALPKACAFCYRVTNAPGRLCAADRKRTGLSGLASYGDYHAPPLARAIAAVKYEGVFAGLPALAERAQERWAVLTAVRPAVAIPIPLARARHRERGFNQAERLARSLATQLDIPINSRLARTRETPSQVGLGRHERARNIEGAFLWCGKRLFGPVIVVDDVATTGATLGAAAATLRAAGAREVWGATLAVDR